MRFAHLMILLFMAAALGCNSGPPPQTVTPAPTPAKKILEEVATTGQITSGIMEVDSAVNDLRAKDATKADKLMKELEALRSAKSPDEVKAKAKAIADQL